MQCLKIRLLFFTRLFINLLFFDKTMFFKWKTRLKAKDCVWGRCVGGCVHMCRLMRCETACTWKALDRWLLQLSLNVASFVLRVKPLSYLKCFGQHFDQGRLSQPSWLFAGYFFSMFILPPIIYFCLIQPSQESSELDFLLFLFFFFFFCR